MKTIDDTDYSNRVKALAKDIDDAALLWTSKNVENILNHTANHEELIVILKKACKDSTAKYLTPEDVYDAFCDFTVREFLGIKRKQAKELFG